MSDATNNLTSTAGKGSIGSYSTSLFSGSPELLYANSILWDLEQRRFDSGEAKRQFDVLVQSHYRAVASFFLRCGFPHDEIYDLTQDTFLQAYRKIETFRGEANLATWIFQIAKNVYKQTLRSLETQKRSVELVELDWFGLDVMPLFHREKRDPLSELILGEQLGFLRAAILDLPPQMRQATLLRIASDLPYREIADRMHVSIETVKAHIHAAKARLREAITVYRQRAERDRRDELED